MSIDTQLADLALVALATLFGVIIGIEREYHGHPAGTRTHALVSLGSAAFTVLSIRLAGGDAANDPTRIAAQIVSGIGFLGAGAILRNGINIRGLTTAASLWATAAIGMAAGGGEALFAAGGTLIVIGSLWPLNALVGALRLKRPRPVRIVVRARRSLGVPRLVDRLRLDERSVRTIRSRVEGRSILVDMVLAPPVDLKVREILARVERGGGVQVIEVVDDDV